MHPKYEGFAGYRTKMKCIDEPYQIWGDYNSDIAQNLMVVFERCDTKAEGNNCKTNNEIDEWLLGKYIFTLENEKTFV